MLSQEIIKHLIVSGAKFKYKSYNHKKAIEEIRGFEAKNGQIPYGAGNTFQSRHSHWLIPNEIKDKHEVWRFGKLWEVRFDRNGDVLKMYIGSTFEFKKCFWVRDVGNTVKPILFKTDDVYNLIGQGFAIEDSL